MSMNKAGITKLVNKMNSGKDGQKIRKLSEAVPIEWSSTGIDALDSALSGGKMENGVPVGGIPVGRIVHVYGPESSGKTTLCHHIASVYPLTLFLPVEGTFDPNWAEMLGLTDDNIIHGDPWDGDEAMQMAIRFAEQGIPLIVIDSVPHLISAENIDKIEKNVRNSKTDEQRIGGVSQVLNRYLPYLEKVCRKTGTSVLLVNQVRDKIGAMTFADQTRYPGGHIIRHSASLSVFCQRKEYLKFTNPNTLYNKAKEHKYGITMKIQVKKSKIGDPEHVAELPFVFDYGFVGADELDEHKERVRKRLKEEYERAWKNAINEGQQD